MLVMDNFQHSGDIDNVSGYGGVAGIYLSTLISPRSTAVLTTVFMVLYKRAQKRLPSDYYLDVVRKLACSDEPKSYADWNMYWLLVGLSMPDRSKVRDQTKE